MLVSITFWISYLGEGYVRKVIVSCWTTKGHRFLCPSLNIICNSYRILHHSIRIGAVAALRKRCNPYDNSEAHDNRGEYE